MLKRVNMKPTVITSKADIDQQISRSERMVSICEDSIKMLRDYPTNGFPFSFSMSGKEVVKFDINESESAFAISFFISWLQYHRRLLSDLKKL